MTDSKVFNAEEKAKLQNLIREGMQVKQEVETLNGGLNDTIKAIAEEMDIKASVLKKAINTAFKTGAYGEAIHDFELLENILETTGFNNK